MTEYEIMAVADKLINEKDTEKKKTWWKYFDKENDMDIFIRKIKYVKNLLLIEDSRDIVWR